MHSKISSLPERLVGLPAVRMRRPAVGLWQEQRGAGLRYRRSQSHQSVPATASWEKPCLYGPLSGEGRTKDFSPVVFKMTKKKWRFCVIVFLGNYFLQGFMPCNCSINHNKSSRPWRSKAAPGHHTATTTSVALMYNDLEKNGFTLKTHTINLY